MSTSRSQQRQDRQERARQLREAERRAERRKRRWIVSGVVAAVVLVAVGIGIGVGASQNSGKVIPPKDGVTTGAKIAVGGMLIGKASAPVTVDAYEDFTCPICGEFESAAGSTVVSLINDGKIKVRYHMMSFIDDHSGGTYSHRSANAFAAADSIAGADKALALHTVLYAHQPSETSKAGLSDAQIIDYAASVGITEQAFVKAVNDMTYKGWVSKVADDASKAGVTGTPTFYLNGRQIALDQLVNASSQQFDPAKFQALVNAT